MKFKIRLRDEVTVNEVEGYPFRVGRFRFFMSKEKTSWNVSEHKTGMAFHAPFGYSTKKEAIRATGEALKRIGDEQLMDAINFYIQRFGILNEV